MNRAIVNQIFARWAKVSKEPTTELHYQSSFELLIAVMLSAQATDKSVNKATASLFRLANTPEALLKLGQDALALEIKTIGLYHTKARHIIQTCQILCAEYAGLVPNHRDALESLPGVGRKTANVILNTAFGQPTIAVDTHVFRVANRTGMAPGKTPRMVEQGLMDQIDPQFLNNAHHWLILHGRYVCTAKNPHCANCLIRDLCEYPHKTDE